MKKAPPSPKAAPAIISPELDSASQKAVASPVQHLTLYEKFKALPKGTSFLEFYAQEIYNALDF